MKFIDLGFGEMGFGEMGLNPWFEQWFEYFGRHKTCWKNVFIWYIMKQIPNLHGSTLSS